MKKVALLAVVLSLITMNAKAQWFDFSENSEDLTIGVNIGAVGYHFNGQIDKTYSDLGAGLSFSFLGAYIDFMYQSPEHKFSSKVTPQLFRDHTALTINAGYKIPVLSWLNLIPVVGYSNETEGWTDCSTINVDYESHSIYHDYDHDFIRNHFNYGLGISAKPIDFLEIGGMCTAHAVYGNISLNLFKLKK